MPPGRHNSQLLSGVIDGAVGLAPADLGGHFRVEALETSHQVAGVGAAHAGGLTIKLFRNNLLFPLTSMGHHQRLLDLSLKGLDPLFSQGGGAQQTRQQRHQSGSGERLPVQVQPAGGPCPDLPEFDFGLAGPSLKKARFEWPPLVLSPSPAVPPSQTHPQAPV